MGFKLRVRAVACALASTLVLVGAPATAQCLSDNGPEFELEDRITVRASLPVFTAWAWVTVADSTGDHTYTWTPVKRRVEELLLERLPRSYLDTLRSSYEALDPDGYHMTVLALQLTPPPDMRLDQSAARTLAREQGADRTLEYLDRIAERAEVLLPVLNEFYHRGDLAGVYREVAPAYAEAVRKYKAGTIAAVRQALEYLRLSEGSLSDMERVVIVPSLVGMLGSAMAPTLGGVTYNVEFPTEPVDSIRFHAHEYIHFMVGGFTRGEEHRAQIERVTRLVWGEPAAARARNWYPDPIDYFDENLVRLLTAGALYGGMEAEKTRRSIEYHAGRGFLLIPAMSRAMRGFEETGESIVDYLPTLLNRVEQRLAGAENQNS